MSKGKLKLFKSKFNEKTYKNNLKINEKLSYNKPPLVSIIIPLFNEERSINNVIKRIPNHNFYEIIIVDDGSTDDSVKMIKKNNNRKIKLIQHQKNIGYGAAILTGFKHATGDIIVTLDSDGQHNPEEIPVLVQPIVDNKADLVVGSRYLGKSNYKVPLYTRVGEIVISLVLYFLYHIKSRNNQSGFRAFSKYHLEEFKNLSHIQFGLCTETLFKAGHKKLRVTEVPIVINGREYGHSYVDLIKIIKSILSCIFVYGLKRFKINKLVPKSIYNFSKYKRGKF